mmetsp:Transcript_4118/g.9884  ORF Transcript_4118/g.9884 Transcript_4118/m.9884 type:complete len:565 (-) Transcript_4118:57-1751(-)
MGAAESTPVVELDQSVAGQSSNAYVNDFFALFLDVKAFPSVVDATIRKLARRSPDVFELKHSRYFVVQDTDPVVPEIAKAILAYYPEVQENLRAVLVPERLSELLFWTRFLFLVKQNTGAGYERERQVAVASVLLACRATTAVYRNLVSDETLTKNDKSPVTIADFASQAIIINELRKVFPDDPIVGEEDAAALRESSAEAAALRDKVLKLVNGAYAERAQAAVAARAANADADADDDDDDGGADDEQAAPARALTADEVLAAIDYGTYKGGRQGRHWTLDPIDGTKGFLRGEQYAVCLALIENGVPVLGVLGCPSVPVSNSSDQGDSPQRGCVFIAVRGCGSSMRLLNDATETPISVSDIADSRMAAFTESVEASHSSHGDAAAVAKLLNVTKPSIRMDSQCKYAALARGDASIYLRLPTRKGYEEKIWDHASGWLIVHEAGGRVTDVLGRELNFSLGRTLRNNVGVVATNGMLHRVVLDAVRRVLYPLSTYELRVFAKQVPPPADIAAALADQLGVPRDTVQVIPRSSAPPAAAATATATTTTTTLTPATILYTSVLLSRPP